MKSELTEILIAVALFAFLSAMGLARLSLRKAYVARLPPCTVEQTSTARENFSAGLKSEMPACQPENPRLASP